MSFGFQHVHDITVYVHVLFFQLVLCTSTTFIPMGEKTFLFTFVKIWYVYHQVKFYSACWMQRIYFRCYKTTYYNLFYSSFHEINFQFIISWMIGLQTGILKSRRMSVNKLNLGIISTFSCQIVSKFDSPFSRKFSFPSTE